MAGDFAVRVDGYDVSLATMREELSNVVRGYPLDPGDTISHRGAKACRLVGWIVRQADGRWIPTALGLDEHGRAGQEASDGR